MKTTWHIQQALILAAASVCAAQTVDVSITGTRSEEDAGRFVWTITNTGSTPITMFRAPYHRGAVEDLPAGWATHSPTGQTGQGLPRGAQILELVAESRGDGILRGQTMEFQVWDAHKRGMLRRQSVVIGLASGEEIVVPGVWCPSPDTYLRKNFPVVGLGTMFLVFVLIKALRKSKTKGESTTGTG